MAGTLERSGLAAAAAVGVWVGARADPRHRVWQSSPVQAVIALAVQSITGLCGTSQGSPSITAVSAAGITNSSICSW